MRPTLIKRCHIEEPRHSRTPIYYGSGPCITERKATARDRLYRVISGRRRGWLSALLTPDISKAVASGVQAPIFHGARTRFVTDVIYTSKDHSLDQRISSKILETTLSKPIYFKLDGQTASANDNTSCDTALGGDVTVICNRSRGRGHGHDVLEHLTKGGLAWCLQHGRMNGRSMMYAAASW